MDLEVDTPERIPGGRLVPELIDGAQAVIAIVRRIICEVLNAAAAIGQRRIDLKIESRVGGFHVVEVCVRENAIPERSIGIQRNFSDDIEVVIKIIEHLAAYQRVVVIREKRLPDRL